jgi:hypothetical protein
MSDNFGEYRVPLEPKSDVERLRAALAAAKAEIEAVREGGMCALSIAEEDHAHTKVALAAERERVEAWKDLFSDEAERTTKLREALEPFVRFLDEKPRIYTHEGRSMALIWYDVMRAQCQRAHDALKETEK